MALLPSAAFPQNFSQQLKRAATFHKRGVDGALPSAATISASVVKLLSSSASNGEFAGESPAGCANFNCTMQISDWKSNRRRTRCPNLQFAICNLNLKPARGLRGIEDPPDSESGSLGSASLSAPTNLIPFSESSILQSACCNLQFKRPRSPIRRGSALKMRQVSVQLRPWAQQFARVAQ